jgi:hypothetical protein
MLMSRNVSPLSSRNRRAPGKQDHVGEPLTRNLLNNDALERDTLAALERRFWDRARDIAKAGTHAANKDARLADRFRHQPRALWEWKTRSLISGW